jgi:uncharacterized RDD family membrane protein YckC
MVLCLRLHIQEFCTVCSAIFFSAISFFRLFIIRLMLTPLAVTDTEYPFSNQLSQHNASFARRTAAAMLDIAFILLVSYALVVGIGVERLALLNTSEDDATELNLSTDTDENNDEESSSVIINGIPVSHKTLEVFMSIAGIIRLLYGMIELRSGVSPGKRLLMMNVVSEDGSSGTRQVFVKRWAIKYGGSVLGVIPFLSDIGLVWNILTVFSYAVALTNRHRQALHDIIAHSRVVKQ